MQSPSIINYFLLLNEFEIFFLSQLVEFYKFDD
jgi:hypothetical protein